MARALVSWAFERGDVQKVIADCLPDNQGSIRVLQKLGMQEVGLEGGLLCWSLTKQQWQAAQQ
jgi:ribosomal-protein-alanine N-acetyltransferase